MDSRIAPLAEILRLNTTLFRNCLDGLSDEQAAARPSGATNNAAFVAAHLTNSRFYLLKALGVDEPDPLAPYLDGRQSLDELAKLPPLAEIQAAWTKAAHLLRIVSLRSRRPIWTARPARSFRSSMGPCSRR